MSFLAALLGFPAAAAEDTTFYRDVRPIVARHCTACHNNDNLADADTSGGLSLSDPDAIFKKSKRAVVQSGRPDKSQLYLRLIESDAGKRMPKDAEPLAAKEIAAIKRWIEGGARPGQPAREPAASPTRARPRVFRELPRPPEAIVPAGALGNAKPGKLTFSGKLGPLPPVQSLAFSPDGRWLAQGSYRRVIVWNLAEANRAAELTDPIGMVHDMDFSPDGARLWLAGGDPALRGELLAYDTRSWKPAARFAEPRDVLYCLDISPAGDRLATVGFDRQLRVFALPDLKPAWAVSAHSDFAFGVGFSGDGTRIATAGKDRAVKIWNAQSGDSARVLSGHQQDVLAVVLSGDGATAFSAGLEPGMRVWNADGKSTLQPGHTRAVRQLRWNPGRTRFVSASDGSARTWLPTGKPDKTFSAPGDALNSAALSADGHRLAAGGFDGVVRIWDARSEKPLATLLAADRSSDAGSDWLILTSSGHGAFSAGLKPRGQFRMDGKVVSSEQVHSSIEKREKVIATLRSP